MKKPKHIVIIKRGDGIVTSIDLSRLDLKEVKKIKVMCKKYLDYWKTT